MAEDKNLVVVVARGLRSDVLGDMRIWPLQTPNMQRLSETGARLVATSACPADPGGLVSLLTGMHARQHGQLCAGDRSGSAGQTLGFGGGWVGGLAAAGYDVRGVGCVGLLDRWLSRSVLVQDVDTLVPARCTYLDAMASKGLVAEIIRQREQRLRRGVFDPYRLQLDPGDDIDSFICARAAEMVDEMPADRPWALVVVLSGPGNDLPPPMMYNELVDPKGLGIGFAPVDLRVLDAYLDADHPRVELQRLDQERVGKIRSDYLGRVGMCDHGIGWLITRLDKRVDRGRTWVSVASDRGQLIGERGVVGHRSFLSGAVEVPVILAPPRPMDQNIQDMMVSTVDVAATFADLCGGELPAESDGRSLLPIFGDSGDTGRGRRGCVCEFGQRIMLETARYKVVFDVSDGKALALYDMLSEQEERVNLVNEAKGGDVLDSLRWQLAEAVLPLRSQPTGVIGAGRD